MMRQSRTNFGDFSSYQEHIFGQGKHHKSIINSLLERCMVEIKSREATLIKRPFPQTSDILDSTTWALKFEFEKIDFYRNPYLV